LVTKIGNETVRRAVEIIKSRKKLKVAELCNELGLSYNYCRYIMLKMLLALHEDIQLVKEGGVDYIEYKPKQKIVLGSG